jgi:hypothetical protein
LINISERYSSRCRVESGREKAFGMPTPTLFLWGTGNMKEGIYLSEIPNLKSKI